MSTLISLGIFDDGDVLPTEVIMLIVDDEEFDVADACFLRAAGETRYGRDAPDHALFWSAHPRPS